MSRALSIVATAIVAYFLSWSLAYVVLVGWDLKYYWQYLRLAWTNPGELPAFLQIFAIVATLIVCILVFVFLRMRAGRVP
jgi:SNF family Na+-dependent transporter